MSEQRPADQKILDTPAAQALIEEMEADGAREKRNGRYFAKMDAV